MASSSTSATAHTQATIQLAKQEYSEHMMGLDEAKAEMNRRPLIVKAYAMDDPKAPSSENVKVVHWVRHGQGFHNLMADLAREAGRTWIRHSKTKENPYYMAETLDAPLTDKGRSQALLLQPAIESMQHQPQLVMLSPNCRAIQTGVIAFECLRGKAPFLAHEMIREENGVHLCDKRRPTSRQQAEFPMVDFSLLESEQDVMFLEDRRETKLEVANRIYQFLEYLEGRSEVHVGVATHSAWLLTLFNANLDCDDSLKGWFQTGELRSTILEFVRA
eukprot:Nitzschia sp. Nitz4//scaffold55_size114948//87753//88688//NITZ4_003917-RA/size114948-snap-gene-0.191-mRNA-1//-1//CDS//3329554578//8712//frame0